MRLSDLEADTYKGGVIARFWSKVDKSGDCWEWLGAKTPDGYGLISVYNKREYTHRLAYAVFHGEVPYNAFVCHKCDNPSCVNPSHLFLGNNGDNMRDAFKKGRIMSPAQKGERGSGAKLTWKQVNEIREIYAPRVVTQKSLAHKYGVCRSNIGRIITRKTWK